MMNGNGQKKEDVDLGVEFLGALVMMLSLGPLIAMRGYVLNVLWGWFVCPVFGVAPPGFLGCVGLAVVVVAFVPRSNDPIEKKGSVPKRVLLSLLRPLGYNALTLGIGYVIHQLIMNFQT